MPYPAGSYLANEDERERKIFVDFSTEEFPIINPEIEINVVSRKLSQFALPGNYQVEISNPTGEVWYFRDIEFESETLKIKKDSEQEVKRIPPFAKISLPISIYNNDAILGQKGKIKVTVQLQDGQNFENEFEVISNTSIKIQNPEKLIFLGGGLVIATLITGSLFLLGRKWANSLRRKGQKSEEESLNLQEISKTLGENQENDSNRKEPEVQGPGKRTRGPAN